MAISVGLRGECFVSPHLPSTEIASSLMLLAKTERYIEYCFRLERMLQPTQFRSQRQNGFSRLLREVYPEPEILRCPFATLRAPAHQNDTRQRARKDRMGSRASYSPRGDCSTPVDR